MTIELTCVENHRWSFFNGYSFVNWFRCLKHEFDSICFFWKIWKIIINLIKIWQLTCCRLNSILPRPALSNLASYGVPSQKHISISIKLFSLEATLVRTGRVIAISFDSELTPRMYLERRFFFYIYKTLNSKFLANGSTLIHTIIWNNTRFSIGI